MSVSSFFHVRHCHPISNSKRLYVSTAERDPSADEFE